MAEIISDLNFCFKKLQRILKRIMSPFLYIIFVFVLYHESIISSNFVKAAEKCPDYKTKPVPNVTKAWSKPCVPNFDYCIPPKGRVPAHCPGKLVYSPHRKRCDLRRACTNTDAAHDVDTECLSKPCGLYAAIDCKKYYVCSGGTKIWKECPGDTTFDFELEMCKVEANCKYPVKPIVPSDLPVEDGFDAVDESERAACPFHDYPEPEQYSPTADPKEPPGIILNSTKVTDWGKWMPWKKCPEGQYFVGMSIWRRTTEAPNGATDHAGVISLGFRCENPILKQKKDKIVGSCAKGAPDTIWDYFVNCERGAGIGFQLSQQADQGDEDDAATDNVKLICSCGHQMEIFKPYHEDLPKYKKTGGHMGEWTEQQHCKPKQALCAFRTQMQDWIKRQEVNLKKEDMTGLNNVKFKCCDVTSPVENCEPKITERYIQTCDNREGFVKRPCPVDVIVGVLYNWQNMSKAVSFYTSIGFDLKESFEALQKRLKEQLPKCKSKAEICLQQWLRGKNEDPKRIFSNAHQESSEVNVTAGVSVRLMQTVVQCGIYEVFTNQILLKPKDVREGKDWPDTELHTFEGSVTYFAKKKR